MSRLGQYLVILPKIIIKLVSSLISVLKDAEYILFASRAKGGVVKAQKRTISFYKRPMRDISHLSLVLVVILALISGIPGAFTTSEKVTIDPFVPVKTASETYVTTNEQRVLEADSVATVSSIYSENLGQDAAKAAEDLNNKINVASGSGGYISSLPIVSMPDSANSRSIIIKYIVQGGDTLSTIAAKFNITTATVRYANNITDENSIKPGQELTILPVTGLLYTVVQGDTLEGIAARYKANKEMIIAQNDLYGEEISPGRELLIPDGEIPEAPKAEEEEVVEESTDSSEEGGSSLSYVKTSTGANHFPWGYCTWWVAHKRYVPWSGNAWQWYGNAQAYGTSTGSTPVPGAIMVTWESGVGHVAYVESVSGNSFTVSEMNYQGYGIVSTRTVTTSSVPLIGFVY